jgi:ABC-2 type transport system ATP-binding protein
LDEVGLAAFAEARVGTFSKGMTQLLGIAQALLGSPKVLILDEPTVGLDPRWSRTAKDRILEASTAGTTVFFSSHFLSEVQELADRVAILDRGKLIAQDTTEALGKRVSPRPRMRLRLGQDARRGEEAVRNMPGVAQTESHDHELVVQCEEEVKAKVVQRLLAMGFEVLGLKTEESSLEDVFLALTAESKGAVR